MVIHILNVNDFIFDTGFVFSREDLFTDPPEFISQLNFQNESSQLSLFNTADKGESFGIESSCDLGSCDTTTG